MEGQVQSFFLKDRGDIPNNQDLPVIYYQGVFNDGLDLESSFARHNWTNSWTGDIFDFHHYHSNSHEVLGVKSGKATVLLGGDDGERLELDAGDVVVLPAGTGHMKLESTDDFEVVGAYPGGKSHNLRKRDPQERAESLDEIRNVPIPDMDPVYGEDGPLLHKWVK